MRQIFSSSLSHQLAVLLVAAVPMAGCQTTTGTALDDKATQGAIAGALLGAAAGAAADGNKRGRGALIGAAVGGLAGGLIGRTLDKQAQEIDAIPDAEVEREPDRIFVAFPADVLFDVDSRALQPGAFGRLDRLADSLLRHPDTEAIIRGHTDSSGSRDYNLRLSEDRADAVRRYLIAEGIPRSRVKAIGFGDAMPLVSNDTAAGRQQNRRVEIEIRPTEAMRQRDRDERRSYEQEAGRDDDYAPERRSVDRYEDSDQDRYDDPYEVR